MSLQRGKGAKCTLRNPPFHFHALVKEPALLTGVDRGKGWVVRVQLQKTSAIGCDETARRRSLVVVHEAETGWLFEKW